MTAVWQVADLVWHIGIVQMFWRQVAVGCCYYCGGAARPDRAQVDGDMVALQRFLTRDALRLLSRRVEADAPTFNAGTTVSSTPATSA